MTNVGYHIRNGWLQKPPLGVQLNWAHPLTKGLVGCWMFNEGGGDKAYDLSGYNNHGTLNGMAFPPTTASGWNPGKDGVGLNFDSSNDFVNCGSDTSLIVTDAITIEAWVKPETTAIGSIVDKRVPNWSNLIYYLAISTLIEFQFVSAGTVHHTYRAGSITQGMWQHIAVSFSYGTGSSIKAYKNGVLQSGKWIQGNGNFSPVTHNCPVSVGAASNIMGTPHSFFNGSIDWVKIYNRALSASEIQQLYMTPYAMFEPATKYTIIDERLRTKHVGSNVAAAQMLRGRTIL